MKSPQEITRKLKDYEVLAKKAQDRISEALDNNKTPSPVDLVWRDQCKEVIAQLKWVLEK